MRFRVALALVVVAGCAWGTEARATGLDCWFARVSVSLTGPSGSDGDSVTACSFPRTLSASIGEGTGTAFADFEPETATVTVSVRKTGTWDGDHFVRANVNLFLDPTVPLWRVRVSPALDPNVPRDDGPGDLGLSGIVLVSGAASNGAFGRRGDSLRLEIFDLDALSQPTEFLARVEPDPSGLFPEPTIGVSLLLDFDGELGDSVSALTVALTPIVPEPPVALLWISGLAGVGRLRAAIASDRPRPRRPAAR